MSAATDTQVDSAQQWDTLQRVILPNASQMDTVPLYMDMGTATGIQLPTVGSGDGKKARAQSFSSSTKEAHVEDFLSRSSTKVRSGERVSFGSYFNAFPASYWRRWTTVDKVRLQVRTQGAGSGHRLQVQRPRVPAARRHAARREARRTTPSSCPLRPSATAAGTGSTSWPAPSRLSWSTREWQGADR